MSEDAYEQRKEFEEHIIGGVIQASLEAEKQKTPPSKPDDSTLDDIWRNAWANLGKKKIRSGNEVSIDSVLSSKVGFDLI